jgi:hypothetical protein
VPIIFLLTYTVFYTSFAENFFSFIYFLWTNLRFKKMQNLADIKTQRNKLKLQHEGFLYVYGRLNAYRDKKFWRCEQFNNRNDLKCNGRLHTTLEDIVLKTISQHTCNIKNNCSKK